MCVAVFIGSKGKRDLSVARSPSGFAATRPPAGEHRARTVLETEHIYEIGSFMGCTCGFYFGPWSEEEESEDHGKRRENAAALKEFLRSNGSELTGVVTLDSHELHHRHQFPKRILDPDSLTGTEFSFEADVIYDLWPAGIPGPARLEQFWEPVRLGKQDIGGIAPELYAYRDDFSGKGWNEVGDDLFEKHDDVFNLMDLDTLKHLMPGFLLYCHRDFGSMTAWGLQNFAGRDTLVELAAMLDDQQRSFLLQALDLIMSDDDADESLRTLWLKNRERF